MTKPTPTTPTPDADGLYALVICGPDLGPQGKGELEVHDINCRHVVRGYLSKAHQLMVRYASLQDLVEEWYGDQLAQDADARWVDFAEDVWVGACVSSEIPDARPFPEDGS